tara:strand:+ start:1472 stop:2701 length:1230 start_codon:yes stop_codon:yes gene_type:complete
MTAINIKNLVEIVQRKVKGVSASTSIKDLENLMELTMLSGGGHLQADSAGFDSDVTDTPGRLLFVDSGGEGFFNFKQTVLSASPTVKPRRGPNRVKRFKYLARGKTYTRAPSPAPSTDVIQGNIGYFGGNSPGSKSITFASNSVSAAISGIATTRAQGTGGASITHGYWMGGGGGPYTAGVQKWPFAATDGLTDVGDLINQSNGAGAHANNEAVGNRAFVYAAGGISSRTNVIQKMPTASDTDFTDVGDLTYTVNHNSGMSSSTHGYTASGNSPPYVTTINKWPFATDTNATLVGNLALAQFDGSGQSSTDNGYHTSGFYNPYNRRKDVQKFPFASDGDGTDIGDLTYGGHYTTGTQSTTNGYQIGGNNMQPYLQYFPFASDTMYSPNTVASSLSPGTQKDQSTQDVAS